MTEAPCLYGSFPSRADAEILLSRASEAAGCRTQFELADFLGVRRASISDAKRRGSIPSEWLLTLLRKKRINPAWVLTGEGSRFLPERRFEDAPQSVERAGGDARPNPAPAKRC